MTAKNEYSPERMADREAIRDVMYRYCRGADRYDIDLFRSCYHPDATDQHGFFTGPAHDFATHAFKQLERCIFTMHRLHNILIEFDGDRAFTESQVVVIHRVEAATGLVDFDNFGRYCDIFEKRNGDWKIFHRLHLPDGDRIVEVNELAGRRRDLPPGGRFYEPGRHGPDDASYLKFDLKKVMKSVPPLDNLGDSHLTMWNERAKQRAQQK